MCVKPLGIVFIYRHYVFEYIITRNKQRIVSKDHQCSNIFDKLLIKKEILKIQVYRIGIETEILLGCMLNINILDCKSFCSITLKGNQDITKVHQIKTSFIFDTFLFK